MKNLVITTLLLLVATIAHPQIPNGNFEEWETVDSIEQPKYWNIDQGLCCQKTEKTEDAIEGDFSLKVFTLAPNFSASERVAEITFHPGQVYHTLSASIKIDSMYMGKALIKILELKDGTYQQIGNWETDEATNGAGQIDIPISQTQPDSLKIQVSALVVSPVQLPVGYAEITIDELELSLSTGIGEQNGLGSLFKIYPNPTTGIIHIDSPAVHEISFVKVYDKSGKLVPAGADANTVDLTTLPAGHYFLEIYTDNEVPIVRLVQKN